MDRRQFIKTGVIGGAMLGALGAWYGYRHHGAGRVEPPALDAAARDVVAAIAPVLLRGALPQDAGFDAALREVIDGVGQAVAGLSASAQTEVGQLFDLLGFPPTRILVAKVGPPWSQASAEQIVTFLEGWRHSRVQLLQTGYAALHDLVMGAWYGNPASWARIGYPGPPEIF